MRKLSVLTSLAALALFTAPVVNAATLLAVDPPDINIRPGTTASNTFNLDDFFNTTTGSVSYTATGGSVSGTNATVDGLANAGTTGASFTGTNGTDTLTVTSSVFVSSFNIGNAPDINNNNRLANVAAGNKFANMIAAGGSFSSALPLTNLPAAGGGGAASPGGVTGGGVSGGAALIATIASVGITTDPVTGLRERTVNGPVAKGTNGQLTVALKADGTYSVTAGASVSGNSIVTLGASAAGGTDAVHLLAAAARDIAATSLAPLGGAALTSNTVTVQPGAFSLVLGPEVPVNGGAATVVLYYTLSSTAGANLAVLGFDGALDGSTVSFSNPGAANLQAGTNKGLATSFTVNGGKIIPGFQLANSGSAAITVTINRFTVASAGPLTDFALNPNATALSSNLSSLTGISGDVLGTGAKAPTASTANNFAAASGSGSMRLAGTGGVANGFVTVPVPQGEVALECYVQRVGAGSGTLAMVLTDGPGTSITAFKPASSIPETGWAKVTVSGTVTGGTTGFFVIQAAGFDVNVDDVAVRIITDKPEHFDADLLG